MRVKNSHRFVAAFVATGLPIILSHPAFADTAVAQPFLKALSYFTTSTELMASNSAVFNLWLAMVGICDGLFVLVVALPDEQL